MNHLNRITSIKSISNTKPPLKHYRPIHRLSSSTTNTHRLPQLAGLLRRQPPFIKNSHCCGSSSSSSSSSHHQQRTIFTSATPSYTSPTVRLINLTKLILIIGTLIGSYGYVTDTRAIIHSWLSVPIIRFLSKDDDPEQAHRLAIKILKFLGRFNLIHDRPQPKDHILSFELWGKSFDNPIGLAAGFDKDGDAIDGLFDIGFGYVEIGSVTPEPQPGNPKPRMFRIPSTNSIVNRYGFNSEGHLLVLSKLRNRLLRFLDKHRHLGYSTILSRFDNLNPVQTAYADSGFTHLEIPDSTFSLNPKLGEPHSGSGSGSVDEVLGELSDQIDLPRSLRGGRVLAVNLGKNKNSEPDSIEDFKLGIQRFGHLADVLVINISSPNTPGLRNLQSKESLDSLLNQIIDCRNQLQSDPTKKSPAVLVKIAPDLSVQELVDVGNVAKDAKVDGIIISNTTTSRPTGSGTEPEINEAGGLSGPPLKPLSLRALSVVYSVTSGSVPLIGCGGISTAEDVLEYGKAGASFVELYSALTYQGIGLVRDLKDGLIELLENDEGGSKKWNEIVGSSTQSIEIDELIEEEQKQRKKALKDHYDQQVKSIRQSIDFIEKRIENFNKKSNALTSLDRLSIEKIDHQQQHQQQPTIPSPLKQQQQQRAGREEGEGERGILIEWKRTRQDQINRNDFKRVV